MGWGGDGGVLNWAIGIDMYTLMCIKLMTGAVHSHSWRCAAGSEMAGDVKKGS